MTNMNYYEQVKSMEPVLKKMPKDVEEYVYTYYYTQFDVELWYENKHICLCDGCDVFVFETIDDFIDMIRYNIHVEETIKW